MNNTTNRDDGIQYIDLDSEHSDDGIEIVDADDIEDTDAIQTEDDDTFSNALNKSSIDSEYRMTMIRRVVMCISAIVFIFSAGMLIYIFMGYHKADSIYNNVANSVFTPVTNTTDSSDNRQDATEPATGDAVNNNEVISGFTYNHEALLEINSDSVGYLIMPSVNISLPIVQGSDNSFYLKHAVTGAYSTNGTLFVDSRIEEGLEAPNSIIYGHNMKNGTMFGSLHKYDDPDFIKKEGNDTFYIYSGKNMYTYKIYSVHNTPTVNKTYTISFADDAAFSEFIDAMLEQSIVQTNVKAVPGDHTVTLSTCTDDPEIRLVVQAVRVATTPLE